MKPAVRPGPNARICCDFVSGMIPISAQIGPRLVVLTIIESRGDPSSSAVLEPRTGTAPLAQGQLLPTPRRELSQVHEPVRLVPRADTRDHGTREVPRRRRTHASFQARCPGACAHMAILPRLRVVHPWALLSWYNGEKSSRRRPWARRPRHARVETSYYGVGALCMSLPAD